MTHMTDPQRPSLLRSRAAIAFGNALRRTRANRGISQMSLAVSSDLDPTYVSLLERGHRVPSFIVIVRLADALRVSSIQLFAEGVARLTEIAPAEVHPTYRLAYRGRDGKLVEALGTYLDLATAIRSAELQRAIRQKTGEPEITHVMEYIRTRVVELSG